jgi:tetratricopeptide (TPR) repeat protein
MTEGYRALAKARSLVALNRWSDAMAALGPALAAEETAGDAYCIQAQCYLGLGNVARAIASSERAVAADPYDEWPYRLLAVSQLRAGRKRKGLAAAEEAARVAPNAPHALHILTLAQLANRKLDDAEATASANVGRNPHDEVAHYTAGLVAARRRRWLDAERSFREALRIDPTDGDAAVQLGEVLRIQGRPREAADAYVAAGRANPTNRAARRGLAKVGLPVLGGGTFLLIKLAAIGGARFAIIDINNPLVVGLLAIAVLALICGLLRASRIRGTSHLSESIRQSLRHDYDESVRSWFFAAGVVALCVGIWASLVSRDHGGGPVVAAGFIAFAAVAMPLAWRRSTTLRSRGQRLLAPFRR